MKTNLEKVYDQMHKLNILLEAEEGSGKYTTEYRHLIYSARSDLLGAANTLCMLTRRLAHGETTLKDEK